MKANKIIKKVRVRLAQFYLDHSEKYFSQGLIEKSMKSCINALKTYKELDSAHSLLCRILMPGEDYLTLLSYFHDFLKPKNYVEIGVFEGRSLGKAGPDAHVIGIDPSLQIKNEIRSQAKLFSITSDEFFALHDLRKELEGESLEFGFIDGAHIFENTLKDFINLERFSNKKTVILVHDCLPITRLVTTRNRKTSFWTGDVWKLVPCLREYRPDLHVHIIPARPSGLALITNLDSTSKVLLQKFSQIVEEYKDKELDYEYLDVSKLKQLAVLPNDWNLIAKAIPA